MVFQISAELLDTLVLAMLEKSDTYCYEITTRLKTELSISESTLYPVLRRLQKNKFLKTYDKPYAGRNRRYYSITASGKKKLKSYRSEWDEYKQKLNTIIGGEKND